MPAFNTNLFKLSTSDYLCTHVHQALGVTEELTTNQVSRQENLMKAYQKLKSSTKSSKLANGMAVAASEDNASNKLDYFLLSQQVNALCEQIDDSGLSGLIPPTTSAQW